jgi:hypothetical protein
VEHLPEATHWVMADAADRVNELLVDFLREDSGSRRHELAPTG